MVPFAGKFTGLILPAPLPPFVQQRKYNRRRGTSHLCRYCCKSPKWRSGHFPAEKQKKRQSAVDRASNLIPESIMRLARCGVVPHVVIQSSHLRLGEFESHAAKRLLQQYLPKRTQAWTTTIVRGAVLAAGSLLLAKHLFRSLLPKASLGVEGSSSAGTALQS